MDLGLTGPVVVVTGGASNIGRTICFEFARTGQGLSVSGGFAMPR